ncbi:MAG: hypothetical protein GW802_15720, partial [Armatimonadetes bacterium]|nr:hypothetical protein [Armatimonadota bacterium]
MLAVGQLSGGLDEMMTQHNAAPLAWWREARFG